MSRYALFLILGLGSGAIYAGLAMGIVVQYKAMGIINFAQGAMAMLAAYQFDELRRTGDLVMPWVVIPARLHITDHPSIGLSLVLVVGLSALFGLALYVAVFHPLRSTPPLAKVVASVGMMIVIQAIVVIQFGPEARVPPPILPSQTVGVLGLSIPRDRFYLALITVLGAAALWALFRYTRFGLATRAAANSERGALLCRVAPDRLAMANSALVSIMVAVFGILSSAITGLDPTKFALFIVPALAAALVGRLSLISVSTAAGLALGMTQSELLFVSTKSWFPHWLGSGAIDALPFVLIAVVLFVSGDRLPARGSIVFDQALRSLRRPERWRTLLIWLAVLVVAQSLLTGQYRFAISTSVIGATVLLSFVVLTGYLGQISLAQGVVAGTAGFAVSRLTVDAGLPFPLAPLLAALFAAVVGCVVGIPGLRIRGVQLAVVTLAGAVAVEQWLYKQPALGGSAAGSPVPPPSLFGVELGPRNASHAPSLSFALFCIAVFGAAAAMVIGLRRSGLGRRMLAVRSNERAAAAAGVSVVWTKVIGLAIAGFIAGIAGTMYGYLQGNLSSSSFTVFIGIQWLVLAYLGGITSISGALAGSTLVAGGIVQVVTHELFDIGNYHVVLSGLGVIITAIFNPEGIAPKMAESVPHRRPARPPRLAVAPTASDAPLVETDSGRVRAPAG
jgi:branched-chain amino acid transport system permease protein